MNCIKHREITIFKDLQSDDINLYTNIRRESKELSKQERECTSSTESIVKSTGNMEIHLKQLKKQVSEFKDKCSDTERDLETELATIEQEERQLKEELRRSNTRLHEVRDEHETLLQDIDTLKETRERYVRDRLQFRRFCSNLDKYM